MNILPNWSFEGDGQGQWTRKTHTGEEFGNWFTPEGGWVGWWDTNKPRPEAHVIPFEDPYIGPPARVYEGHYAVKMHKSFEAWTGGHYAIVDGLTPGRRYRTGFMAHAWANHDGLPHAGDPNCAPMGCGPLWVVEEFLPPLNGNPVNDAWWAALFQVGAQSLAPGQAPDPFYNVEWGANAAIYNMYQPVPTLEFEATQSKVAIYLRAAFKWQFRNNDAYMDGGFLREVEGPEPREYDRTYVLLPNNQPFDPQEQMRITGLNPGLTIGPSADDAAIDHPYLKSRTVISYKPHTWGGVTALEAFWREYYDFPKAGDTVEYREMAEPVPTGDLLWQCDPQWRDYVFGDNNCHQTLCQVGCFVVNLAMAQRFFHIKDDATPVTVDTALGSSAYVGCVANWGGNPTQYAQALRLKVTRTTSDAVADAHLAEGKCAMAEVSPVSREHFVLVVEKVGNRYHMLDPYRNVEAWLDTIYSGIDSWRLIDKVEPPSTLNLVGLHLQQEVGDWLEASEPPKH